MNHSIHSADRATHLKIVAVALVAGLAVAAFGISARSTSDYTQTAHVIKAGKTMARHQLGHDDGPVRPFRDFRRDKAAASGRPLLLRCSAQGLVQEQALPWFLTTSEGKAPGRMKRAAAFGNAGGVAIGIASPRLCSCPRSDAGECPGIYGRLTEK